MSSKLPAGTMVPIAAVIAAVGITVAIVRTIDSPKADYIELRTKVAYIEGQIAELRSRQDGSDKTASERYEKLLFELGTIKERLGVAETRQHK